MPARRRKPTPNIVSTPQSHPKRISKEDIQQVLDAIIARGKKQQPLPFPPKKAVQPKKDTQQPIVKPIPPPKADQPAPTPKPLRSPSWLRKQKFKRDFRRGKKH